MYFAGHTRNNRELSALYLQLLQAITITVIGEHMDCKVSGIATLLLHYPNQCAPYAYTFRMMHELTKHKIVL